jgi:hypothetical protein
LSGNTLLFAIHSPTGALVFAFLFQDQSHLDMCLDAVFRSSCYVLSIIRVFLGGKFYRANSTKYSVVADDVEVYVLVPRLLSIKDGTCSDEPAR